MGWAPVADVEPPQRQAGWIRHVMRVNDAHVPGREQMMTYQEVAPIEKLPTAPTDLVPRGTFHGDDDIVPRGTFH
jgi:hypothetical protein